MEYVKFLEENGIEYDTDVETWKLKNEKQLLLRRSGNCYDTSYCAWKHFNGSMRIWIAEVKNLTKSNLRSLKKGIVPEDIQIGATHCICVYIDTSWRGLHSNTSYVWWEYTWDSYRGIHKYNSLLKLMDDIKSKWNRTPEFTHLIFTQITNTKIGCSLAEFVDRGLKSKIIHVAEF